MVNDLERYFTENTGKLIHKWKHYFEIYDRHFARFRGQEITLVEFGVSEGGSLDMWKSYFGEKVRIVGVDVNPWCQRFASKGIEIVTADQADVNFLRAFRKTFGKIDILIDDGGHTMAQQINTFEELFPAVDENGVYLCEDLHTSYWQEFGGGYLRPGTFIEHAKRYIDQLNAWHSKTPQFTVSEFTRSAHSMHFYDSVLVIEKRRITEPYALMTGVKASP
jgi:hypothetical protein